MAARHAGIWQPGPGSRVDTQHQIGQGCILALDPAASVHGNYLQDLGWRGNHGTLMNTPSWSAGPPGCSAALAFVEGNSQYVALPANAAVQPAIYPFTLHVVFRIDASSASTDTVWCNTGTAPWHGVNINYQNSGGLLEFETYDGTSRKISKSITEGVWCTATFVGTSATLRNGYVDGVSVGTGTDSCTPNLGTSVISNLARYYSGSAYHYMTGAIVVAFAWTRALDTAEVEMLYREPYAHIWVPGRRSTWWFSAAAATASVPLPVLLSSRRRSA